MKKCIKTRKIDRTELRINDNDDELAEFRNGKFQCSCRSERQRHRKMHSRDENFMTKCLHGERSFYKVVAFLSDSFRYCWSMEQIFMQKIGKGSHSLGGETLLRNEK